MATTTIILIDRNTNEFLEGVRVTLSFPYGGFTEDVWTDYDGEAIINHSSVGEACLYINGNYICNVMTPGVIRRYKVSR